MNTKQIEVIQKNQEGKLDSRYDNAFQALKSEMEPKIFESLEVFRMSDLRQRYMELLSSQDVQNTLFRSEKLKVRMQKGYHGRISFWYPRYRSDAEIVCCDAVSKGQIIESGLNCSVENDKFIRARCISHESCVSCSQDHVCRPFKSGTEHTMATILKNN